MSASTVTENVATAAAPAPTSQPLSEVPDAPPDRAEVKDAKISDDKVSVRAGFHHHHHHSSPSFNNHGQYKRHNNNNNHHQHHHHHQHHNYSSSGHGGENGVTYYANNNFRRYNNNHNHSYNSHGGNGYRSYGNNRRNYQHHQSDYYHNQNNNQYSNNHNNQYSNNNQTSHNGYCNRGPRGYHMNNRAYNNHNGYRRGPNPQHHECDENSNWPPKRGNWTNFQNESFPHGYQGIPENLQKPFYSPCRQVGAEASNDLKGTFGHEGLQRNNAVNGNLFLHHQAWPYECYNGQPTPGNSSFPYSHYHYFYHANSLDNEQGSAQTAPCHSPPSVGLVLSSENSITKSEDSVGSPASEKNSEFQDELTDTSDTESITTTFASTRSHTPDDLSEDCTTVNTETTYRVGRLGVSSHAKERLSPNSSSIPLGLPYYGRKSCHHSNKVHAAGEMFEMPNQDYLIKQHHKFTETLDDISGKISDTGLDRSIWSKFVENVQTPETFRKKMELWRDVFRIVHFLPFMPWYKPDQRNFKFFGLEIVGSTYSGFGSSTSDVDMCLIIRDTEVDQRFDAVEQLQSLSRSIQNLLHNVEDVDMIYAKVPILKFRDVVRRLDVDLNCNNFVGIRNTHLLVGYSQMDWRLRPLVLVVKLWAQFHKINDAKCMTISSYSLALMVIHYLQCGLDEPVLPNLHKMYPEKFSNTVSILNVNMHEVLPPWESKNQAGLGELLVGFLKYFSSKFNYSKHAISVRCGGTIPIKQAANHKSVKNDFHQWKFLCVEEPFDRTNTARSVYDRDIFERIIGIFYISWQRLAVSQDLESIFTPISEEDLRAILKSNTISNRLRC